jgi:hypothetical protein
MGKTWDYKMPLGRFAPLPSVHLQVNIRADPRWEARLLHNRGGQTLVVSFFVHVVHISLRGE